MNDLTRIEHGFAGFLHLFDGALALVHAMTHQSDKGWGVTPVPWSCRKQHVEASIRSAA